MPEQISLIVTVAIVSGLTVWGIITFVSKLNLKRYARWEAEYHESEDKKKEREIRQKRDHQLNHGRMIYNWLKKELGSKYEKHGLRVYKRENNGGSFLITIEVDPGDGISISLLQISYDFLNYPEPYLGHLHYGAYGPDILFWVGDHAPQAYLQELVFKTVHEFYARRGLASTV